MPPAQPESGDQVTYIDDDGGEHYGIVLEPIPDAAYITLARVDSDPREEYVGPSWEVETSVYPHDDTGHDYACGSHAFKPGWE